MHRICCNYDATASFKESECNPKHKIQSQIEQNFNRATEISDTIQKYKEKPNPQKITTKNKRPQLRLDFLEQNTQEKTPDDQMMRKKSRVLIKWTNDTKISHPYTPFNKEVKTIVEPVIQHKESFYYDQLLYPPFKFNEKHYFNRSIHSKSNASELALNYSRSEVSESKRILTKPPLSPEENLEKHKSLSRSTTKLISAVHQDLFSSQETFKSSRQRPRENLNITNQCDMINVSCADMVSQLVIPTFKTKSNSKN